LIKEATVPATTPETVPGDCQLNEDEQILIFSLVKEKMQVLADELCIVHEYQLYKDLIREVRLLEVDIGLF
jgi:hypothetical protein